MAGIAGFDGADERKMKIDPERFAYAIVEAVNVQSNSSLGVRGSAHSPAEPRGPVFGMKPVPRDMRVTYRIEQPIMHATSSVNCKDSITVSFQV